jgi:hypothetical protein
VLQAGVTAGGEGPADSNDGMGSCPVVSDPEAPTAEPHSEASTELEVGDETKVTPHCSLAAASRIGHPSTASRLIKSLRATPPFTFLLLSYHIWTEIVLGSGDHVTSHPGQTRKLAR